MNHRATSFARHIQDALRPYRWFIVGSTTLLAWTLLVGLAMFVSRTNKDLNEALAPYLATLVESQDRTELMRVLEPIAEKGRTAYVIVQNGTVLASTRGLAEIDQPFSAPHPVFSLLGTYVSPMEMFSRIPIARPGGPALNAELYSFKPTGPTLVFWLVMAITLSAMNLFVTRISSRRMNAAVTNALSPLQTLREDIREIANAKVSSSKPLTISELDELRRTISQTKLELANTQEKLAEQRARQLNAKSYKDLIHDLHNPVAALRQWIEILTAPESPPEDRDEAKQAVPRIADQILRQIGSARNNLAIQPEALRESDVRDCLTSSFQQIRSVLTDSKTNLALRLPEQPVIVAHDPDLLQRAVMNLLENGVEASRGQVELSLEHTDTHAHIRVSDDGEGMNESDITVYLQGRGQSKKAPREALGLSSANHIVRTHGGRLIYRASAIGGATFEIRLETRC